MNIIYKMSIDIKTYNKLHNEIYKNNLIGGDDKCIYYGYGFPNICVLNKDDKPKQTISSRHFSTDNIVSISDILLKKNYNMNKEIDKKEIKRSIKKSKNKKNKK